MKKTKKITIENRFAPKNRFIFKIIFGCPALVAPVREANNNDFNDLRCGQKFGYRARQQINLELAQ
jgi:hypothetical protein